MLKKGIEQVFATVKDRRSIRNQKHPFTSLLGISLLGSLAGIDSFSGLGDYAEMHYESLSEVFELPYGAPSHDTFQRLFDALEPSEFHDCFFKFTQQLSHILEGVIAVDGKTIRNSSANPLHVVNAWCEANQLVLAQLCVEEKSNEITAIPLLLKLLDLDNRIITIDAMGCQRDIAAQVVEQGGDYVLGLKANQKSLLEDVQAYFMSCPDNHPSWEEYDKGHGRLEHRHCYATDDIDWLCREHEWPGLKSIAKVESTRTVKGRTEKDIRYYISSLPGNPEQICRAARAHWSVENKLHWRLDVLFNEDGACIRNDNAIENMSIMRKWALNILNQKKGISSIKSLQRKASMSFAFMKNLLSDYFHA